MDQVLFTVGGSEISYGVAAGLAAGLVVLLLVGLLIAYFRADRARIAATAEATTETLRANFREHLDERDRQLRELKSELAVQIETNGDLRARSAALEAQMNEQARQEEENLQRFMAARQQMSDEFKALAGEVLKTHGETFSKQNREQVDLLLKPLADKIVEFQAGLVKDRAEMGERIRNLTVTGLTMSQEANALTRALKGNSQVQGAWGEMILSGILERCGLREGFEFRTQQSHGAELGGRVRTDVEILLPNGDVMIIDSKVSLTAFEGYVNASDELERAQLLKAHAGSLRGHIRTLAGKEYQRHAHSGFDFVFMFVPIESAFSTAITAEPDLLDFALANGVLLTTPTTLMSALRTVRNVWDIEKRQQNAEQIAERAGALYDKVAGFLDNMDRLGQSLDRTKGVFEDARNQLVSGRGSVVRQIELLRELGAKTNKQVPAGWVEGASELPPIAKAQAS
jgi:DNA recombination protein RmuC